MKRYTATWWDGLEWRKRCAELFALDEAQVRAWVDNECAPQYRNKGDSTDDTLVITDEGLVDLPYVVEIHY
jgi:hypothetical protein